jgi:hypothetical protein
LFHIEPKLGLRRRASSHVHDKAQDLRGKALADQQLDRDHDFVIRNPNTAFVTESLRMDWLQTQFIPKNDQL